MSSSQMLTYAEYIQRSNELNIGVAGLVLIVSMLTALVALSIPSRAWVNRLRVPTLLPYLPLAGILLLAFVVRVLNMFDPPWYDETFTSAVSRVAWGDLPTVLLSDVHPPLPYVMYWLITHAVGESIFALRLPSLIFGLINIWQIYRLAWVLGLPVRTAQTAAFLLAVLPVHITYSTEARAYTLLVFLVLYAILAILEDKPGRFLLVSLLGFVHAQGFIYLGVLGLWAIGRKASYLKYVMTSITVSGLWLPVLAVQALDVGNGWWNPPLSLAGVAGYFIDTTIGRAIYPLEGLFVYSIIIALTVISLWQWYTRQNRSALWFYLAVPVDTALIALLWGANIFIARSLLPAACLITIMWAYTLTTLPPHHVLRGATVLALALAVFVLSTRNAFQYDDYMDCKGRPIFAASNHLAILAFHYNPDKTIYVRSDGNDYSQWLTPAARDAFGFVAVDTPPAGACIIYQLSPLVDEPQRQWVTALLTNRPPAQAHLYIDRDIYKLWVYDL